MNQPSPSADREKDQRLNALLAEYMKRRDAGRPVNQKTLLAAYPDLADALQSWFDGEALIEGGVLATTKLGKVPPRSAVRETIRPSAVESETASEFTPRMFGRYQLLRPLGEGAMGSVFLAKDTTLDRQVALKVPKSDGTGNAEFMQRFAREAKAAAALKHPNICSVFDAGEQDGTAYITMDFIDGVPLSRFIGTGKLQSLESILRMLKTIAQAIEHAHSKGVIHRDLKPGNILVDEDLNPVVTDFGLARRVESSDESRITQEGLLIGTPAYMAPEQVKGEQAKVGTTSDIYSLGVIFFEMLTCRLPFEGKISELLAKVLRDAPPIPSKIRTALPEDVDDLCLKMLQKLPEHRYGSIADVIKAITLLENKIKVAPLAAGPNAQQQAPFEIRKAHIELMLKKGQYAAAIQDLEKLAAEKSPGARVVGEWARKTLTTARAESKALSPAGLAALLQTAEQMFQKSDDLGCIQLLEDVPALRRTEGMEDLVKKARKREADSEELLADIRERERRQEIDELEPLVKRFLKLKPGSSYGKRLLEALQSYRKTPASRRTYRYDKGRLQPMPEPSFLRQWAVLGSLVFILVFLSMYSYVIFYLKSGNQVLAVHVDDDWLRKQGGEITLLVDGDKHTISTTSKSGEELSIVVTLGEHTFSVKHGDTVVHDPRTFQIEKDGRRILQITATDMQLTNQTRDADSPNADLINADLVKIDAAMPRPESAVDVEQNLPGQEDWVTLFDGKTLAGWDGDPRLWSVQDGAITGKTTDEVTLNKNSCIIWQGGETDNFELELEYRIVNGNSGIQYRSFELPGGKWLIGGYQADIDSGDQYSGVLYEEAARKILARAGDSTEVNLVGERHKVKMTGKVGDSVEIQKNILKEDWNRYRIVAQGYQFQHFINDMKAVDVIDNDPRGRRPAGLLALQLHVGPPMTVQFRNIRMKQLRTIASGAVPAAGIIYAPANESLKYSSQIDGATKEQLVAWAASLPEGYRPTWISVQPTRNEPLFNAVAFATRNQGEWSLEFYDTNNTNDMALFEKQRFERPIEVFNAYKTNTTFERLTVWSNGKYTDWWHGDQNLVSERIRDAVQQHRERNSTKSTLLPRSLQGHDNYYSVVLNWRPYGDVHTELSLSYDELVAKVDEYRNKGWRPHIVDSVLYTMPHKFLAVFVDNQRGEKWDFSPRLTASEYYTKLKEVDAEGGHPRCVYSKYSANREMFYGVVWDYRLNPPPNAR